jgi:hypothetical protein
VVSLAETRRLVDAMFNAYPRAKSNAGSSVLSPKLVKGKVYEAWVLAAVLEHLRIDEGYSVVLRGGSSYLCLRASGGPISEAYPHFELSGGNGPDLEVWTDIEFLALGYHLAGKGHITRGDIHELDVVVVRKGATAFPDHRELLIGVECKATPFAKHMFRAVIGVRRELSLLTHTGPHGEFRHWPGPVHHSDPASSVLVFSTSSMVTDYRDAGEPFDVQFFHEPI